MKTWEVQFILHSCAYASRGSVPVFVPLDDVSNFKNKNEGYA